MDYNYALVQPPANFAPAPSPVVNNTAVQSPASLPDYEPESLKEMVYLDAYTCISAVLLIVTFVIIVTRFRLWHTNTFLRKIIKLANHPVNNLINQAIGVIVSYMSANDLYLIWVVVLFIAFDYVFTVSQYSLLEPVADRRSREYGFLYSCTFTGVIIIVYKNNSQFYLPLLVLLALVLAKFLIRITSYIYAERAYGLKNVNLVAEYMKSEHQLTNPSDAIDPKCMKGYKYLVRGEEKIKPKIEAPDYSLEVELTNSVVTVERVWSCKEGLLHPFVDKDGALKDVCLSFALFKLLRRQMFDYPDADQTEKTKTRQLIFDGLLSSKANDGEVDKKRVFRVIKMELGFLRDLFFTKYPVGFAFGFPVLNLLVLCGTLGVTIWIAVSLSIEKKLEGSDYYLLLGGHNIDYTITHFLLMLIMTMELFEVLMYVFCDWTKVILVCQNVKRHSSNVADHLAPVDASWLSGYKVLASVSKLSFSRSVKTTLRQYSLLNNCKKQSWRSNYNELYYRLSNCIVSTTEETPPMMKEGKPVHLTKDPEVMIAIFDTLTESQSDFKNGMSAMRRNGVNVFEDLPWAQNLRTPVHIIMVWHIATSFCAIHQEKVRGNKESFDHFGKKVSVHLSEYCAYLVAFHPDLLSLTKTRYIFWKIAEETSEFFEGANNSDAKYEKMMSCRDGGQTIIHRGSELGRYLIKNIPDDANRWKIMADFWSELILSVAPAGSARAHLEQLGNGSEFITHLWALLYHAGFDTMNAEYHP